MKNQALYGAGATSLLLASLALAGCNPAEEKAYEADATDQSGGEFVVSEEDPDAVPVDVPETEMTAVPADEGAAAMEPAETE